MEEEQRAAVTYRLLLGTLGRVNTRIINRILLPRGRLEDVNAGCDAVREPRHDHSRKGIPHFLSLGAVESTVNASVSRAQGYGCDDSRRNSALGHRAMTTATYCSS